MKKIIDYALANGINSNSRILNVTHVDLDGIVSTINLKNFFKNVFFIQKNYDNINEYFKQFIFTGKHTFRQPDFIIVTDISLSEETVLECQQRGLKLIILDHHETAYNLNKFENCYVDTGDELSGAGVTLQFIKGIGFNETYLDKLNDIANQFDLYLFKKHQELRKFEVCGKKRSLAEMLNVVYFKSFNKDDFIERWFNGWGKGFNVDEINILKRDQEEANVLLETIIGNKQLEVQLESDKVLLLTNKQMMYTSEYYLDEKGMNLILYYNHSNMKYSGRVNDKSKINIGKIFKKLCEKFDYISNGGGHEKAGGGNLSNSEHLDEFIENIVKLCSYYER
jgi:oligoribonuclease NrnB/cAMP/cGMP phosphodiesterase (DHH superfamily)